jgi:hypothetical protein
MYLIGTLEKCDRFLKKLRDNSWSLWQMQYTWNDPEGFHAWFMKKGEKDIELVTYSEEIQDKIVKFNEGPGV